MKKGQKDMSGHIKGEQPLVSVVSVYYNRQDWVIESIKSLLNQTYENIEVIVIDDGSTDKTFEVLRSIKDARLEVHTHSNRGFTKSVKKAIELSSGEIIAIHGSGDISYPERIEKEVRFLQEHENVGVVSCYVDVYDVVNDRTFSYNADTFSSNTDIKDYRKISKKTVLAHGPAMLRKDAYQKTGGYRDFFKYSQDRDLWFRMSLITDFAIIPELLYKMYVLPASISTNPKKQVIQAYLSDFSVQCFKMRLSKGFDYLDEYGSCGIFFRSKSKTLSKKFYRMAFIKITKGDYDKAKWLNELSINEKMSVQNLGVQILLYLKNIRIVVGFTLFLFAIYGRIRQMVRHIKRYKRSRSSDL